jgi:hypothetical protein
MFSVQSVYQLIEPTLGMSLRHIVMDAIWWTIWWWFHMLWYLLTPLIESLRYLFPTALRLFCNDTPPFTHSKYHVRWASLFNLLMKDRLNRRHHIGISSRSEVSEKGFVDLNWASSLVDSAIYKPASTSRFLSRAAATTAAFKYMTESLISRKHLNIDNNNQPIKIIEFMLQHSNNKHIQWIAICNSTARD